MLLTPISTTQTFLLPAVTYPVTLLLATLLFLLGAPNIPLLLVVLSIFQVEAATQKLVVEFL